MTIGVDFNHHVKRNVMLVGVSGNGLRRSQIVDQNPQPTTGANQRCSLRQLCGAMPAAKNCSASLRVDTVIPDAPARI